MGANTGGTQDANSILIPQEAADKAMDAAACIGCGACVASCPNASAMLGADYDGVHCDICHQKFDPFFEETYYITASRHPAAVRERVISRVQQACTALGLREGPVHAELRIHAGDGVIMEVASRTIGGDCARLLQFGTGQGLEDLVISHAIGQPQPVSPQDGGAGVLMIPIPRASWTRTSPWACSTGCAGSSRMTRSTEPTTSAPPWA